MSRAGPLVVALIVVSAGLGTQGGAQPMRVLFIGNSLTVANDVPGIFERLAEAAGELRPVTSTVAVGGFSLEDHWQRGAAQRAIAQRPWDIVVLQQGPSAAIESRRLLISYTRRFADAIGKAGARPALYMVWPSLDRQHDVAGVSLSYRRAASSVNGILMPVADAWRIVIQRHRDLKLYSEDRLHPTFAGSYLAALVMFERLYGRSGAGLPALGLALADAKTLQDAASEVSRK